MWGNFAIVSITNIAMRTYIFSSVRFFRYRDCKNLPKWVDWTKTSVTEPIDKKNLLYVGPFPLYMPWKVSYKLGRENSSHFPLKSWLTGFEIVPPNEDNLLKAIANQPVSAVISMPRDYTRRASEIFCSHNPYRTTHAITIVGYGEEKGKKFWLIKNSYGTNSGKNGYFKLKRGDSSLDQGVCHIAYEAWIPHIDLRGKDYYTFVKKSSRVSKKESGVRRKRKYRGREFQGDLNVMEERSFSGTMKKETLTSNNNNKMEADEAALFSSFEKWMAEYGKVYRNETEKAWRFKIFRAAVRKVEYYKEKYGKDACVLNEFSAEFPGEWFSRCRGYTLSPHPLGDSNVEEGNSAGVGTKKMWTNNKGAGKMTLLRWFEQWMAEYGKDYPNEAEKAMRFKYFKKTVRTGKYYNERYREGEFVLNEFAAESPKEWLVRSQRCTLSPHVIDQLDPVVRKCFGIRKVI